MARRGMMPRLLVSWGQQQTHVSEGDVTRIAETLTQCIIIDTLSFCGCYPELWRVTRFRLSLEPAARNVAFL